MSLELRPTVTSDLDELFRMGQDPEAVRMAAFTVPDPTDRAVFDARSQRHMANPSILNYSILIEGVLVGSIASFEVEGDRELTYWIDRAEWGKGIASRALAKFLELELTRPLFGRAAADNQGSRRVLEKAGFVLIGTDRGYANAREAEIEEVIYRLE